MYIQNKKSISDGFTLVELIVVITIIAILGTIAFISLQGYSAQARDSKRLSDINNIKSSLELFSLNTGKYPIPDGSQEVSYSGELVWTQGLVGDNVTTNLSKNLPKKPTDPLTETEYTYSTTNTQTKYELLSIYEGDLVSYNNLLNSAKAASSNYTKITGNYDGIFVKTKNYYIPTPSIITSEDISSGLTLDANKIKSQITNGGSNIPSLGGNTRKTEQLTGLLFKPHYGTITKESTIEQKKALGQAIKDAYVGSSLANKDIYKTITETADDDLDNVVDSIVLKTLAINSTVGGTGGKGVGVGSINSDTCDSAGWIWVEPANDVYIGTTQGNGFCISPAISGSTGLSWNGWGTNYGGWDAEGFSDTGVDFIRGQTKILDSQNGYSCKALGTASSDFDTNDNLVGRMKWLVVNGNSDSELSDIDWIQGAIPPSPKLIPALFIADCIDGVKDLGTTMNYKHRDDSFDEITYAEYSTDAGTGVQLINDITYQNRQKYLTAWTQKSGSHLPSAFAYIDNNTSGGEINPLDSADWNFFTSQNAKGEYQLACENGKFGPVTYDGTQFINSEDDINTIRILLSAIGSSYPSSITDYRSDRAMRLLGYNGCGDMSRNYSGRSEIGYSARFVVRP